MNGKRNEFNDEANFGNEIERRIGSLMNLRPRPAENYEPVQQSYESAEEIQKALGQFLDSTIRVDRLEETTETKHSRIYGLATQAIGNFEIPVSQPVENAEIKMDEAGLDTWYEDSPYEPSMHMTVSTRKSDGSVRTIEFLSENPSMSGVKRIQGEIPRIERIAYTSSSQEEIEELLDRDNSSLNNYISDTLDNQIEERLQQDIGTPAMTSNEVAAVLEGSETSSYFTLVAEDEQKNLHLRVGDPYDGPAASQVIGKPDIDFSNALDTLGSDDYIDFEKYDAKENSRAARESVMEVSQNAFDQDR